MLSATQASVEFIECGRAIEVNRFYFAPTPQAAWRSKWNFVCVRLGSPSGFRRRAWFAGAPSAITLIAAISSTTAARTSQHLHRFADYLQLAPLLSRLFIVPSIELEPALIKNEIHIVPRVQFAGGIGKLTFIHLLYLLDLRPFFFKLRFQAVDHVFHGVVFPLGIKHEQRFVTIHHGS